MLTTDLILVPGCEWAGAMHPPSICDCKGMSYGDLFFALRLHCANPLSECPFSVGFFFETIFEIKKKTLSWIRNFKNVHHFANSVICY